MCFMEPDAPVGCATAPSYDVSPRIVPVPLFDIDEFYAGEPEGRDGVTITNIFGSSSRACAGT